MILILGGFLQVFVGNELTDTALAVGGAFLFSLFIIVDTQMIMTRLSAEEYILATIQLYLDIVNLFIEILNNNGHGQNFSNMYVALTTGLMVLILGGFLQIFFGNEMTDTALAVGGAFLFSMFIIVDTQMIMTRLSAEEYILATIQLYLDIVNLFIEILKILEKINRK